MENLNAIPGFIELYQKSYPNMVPIPSALPQTTVSTNTARGSGFPFIKVIVGGIAILLVVYAIHKLVEMNEESKRNSLERE